MSLPINPKGKDLTCFPTDTDPSILPRENSLKPFRLMGFRDHMPKEGFFSPWGKRVWLDVSGAIRMASVASWLYSGKRKHTAASLVDCLNFYNNYGGHYWPEKDPWATISVVEAHPDYGQQLPEHGPEVRDNYGNVVFKQGVYPEVLTVLYAGEGRWSFDWERYVLRPLTYKEGEQGPFKGWFPTPPPVKEVTEVSVDGRTQLHHGCNRQQSRGYFYSMNGSIHFDDNKELYTIHS